MRFSSAVIAGGRSIRFGSPKQMAEVDKETLLERALRLARAISPHAVIVGSKAIDLSALDCPVLLDENEGIGPIEGIRTALLHTEADAVAVIPCDLPLLDVSVYELLMIRAQRDRPTLAVSHRGLEPLVSVWPVDIAEEIGRYIRSGGRSIRDFLNPRAALSIDVRKEMDRYDPDWFANVNTREDLEAVLRRMRR